MRRLNCLLLGLMVWGILFVGVMGQAKRAPVPLNNKRFEGITITILVDEFVVNAIDWCKDDLKRECGVELEAEVYPSYRELQSVYPTLLAPGAPPWDAMIFCALFTADFIATGKIEPLDKYFLEYEGTEEYKEDIMPAYREFYCKLLGKWYTLPFDGDAHMLHYRPSFFENEEYKREFKQKCGYELHLPETWDEFNDVAEFFHNKGREPGKGFFGTQVQGTRPFTFAWFYNIAAPMGVKYFTEDMEPAFNTPAGVRALEILKEQIKYSPPGSETFLSRDCIGNWQQGVIPMCVWFMDLREFSSAAKIPITKDTGSASVPGIKKDGKIIRRVALPFSRVGTVMKDIPDKKKEAAFYVLYRLSHPDYSIYTVADPYCGLDPYLKSHASEKAIAQYTKPNPLRGVALDYPMNEGIFETIEEARNHVMADLRNKEVGFPQPNWPGASEYCDTLSKWIQAALSGEVSCEEALDKAAQEWKEIVKRRGKEEQKKFYEGFVAAAKELGYW